VADGDDQRRHDDAGSDEHGEMPTARQMRRQLGKAHGMVIAWMGDRR
jgi:hypothetical protein